jgi:cyclase
MRHRPRVTCLELVMLVCMLSFASLLGAQAEWAFPDALGVPYGPLPPYPETALPSVSLGDSTTVNFGGHEIALAHFPGAHTDADLAVLIRDVNVLHTGDLFASGGFVPPLDSYHGGTIDGWIAAVGELIRLTDADTKVVPGHGPIADRQALVEFRDMLAEGRGRIAELVDEGKTIEEAVAANPMDGLAAAGGEQFTRTVYAELADWTLVPTR